MTTTRRPRRPLAAVLTLLGALALGGGVSACRDILTEDPKTIIVPDNLYVDLNGFEAGLNGLYALVRRERFGDGNDANNIIATAYSIGVDNGFGNYLSPPERVFSEFGVRNNPQDGFITNVWRWLYQTVNASNVVIDRAENPAVKWSPEDKARVVAEARLIRAWAYRHLTYLYGDVPLVLHEQTGDNIRTDFERAPRAEVRKQMEEDLLFAEANLPVTSPNAGKVTKAVAQHYLAELYLAMGDAAKAEAKASAVTGGTTYRLITARYGVRASQPGVPFMDQFVDGNVNRSQGNTEALWVLQYAENVPGGGGNIMRRSWVTRYETNPGMLVSPDNGGRGIGRLAVTRYAITVYDTSDQRGGQYALRRFYLYNNPATLPKGKKLGDTLFTVFTKESVSNRLWPSTRKWDWTSAIDPTGGTQWGDQPYLRLAETYLLLAEAQFKQGELSEAATTINALRSRAGAQTITAAQVTLDAILDERSRELLTEEQRRYTLLRTGTWFDRTKKYNPLAAPVITLRDTLLPIPQTVIDGNLTKPMPQNPGF
jgi:hypothetical protein